MSPDLDFHAQPLQSDGSAGTLLRGLLNDEAFGEVAFVVAWARFRGLWRVRDELEAFKARGTSTIVLGIDEGGATRPGLLLAIELFTEAYVFHDERPGTFHPKLYLARGPDRARLIVGSSNVTPGGLFTNVEASLDATFDLPREKAHPALAKAEGFIEALLVQPDACSRLTPALVDALVANDRYRVAGVERRRIGGDATMPGGVDAIDVDEETTEATDDERFFGHATFAGVAPAMDDEGRSRQAELEIGEEAGSELLGSGGGRPVVRASWSKTLSRADAQQPEDPARTSLTYVLRLSKAGNPIDWRTYFRRELFSSAQWVSSQDRRRNPIETARVPFHVVIGGVSHGVVSLTVDHAPHRDAGQSNVPTILHWGDMLGSILRSTPLNGRVITLARLSNGDYELTIA